MRRISVLDADRTSVRCDVATNADALDRVDQREIARELAPELTRREPDVERSLGQRWRRYAALCPATSRLQAANYGIPGSG